MQTISLQFAAQKMSYSCSLVTLRVTFAYFNIFCRSAFKETFRRRNFFLFMSKLYYRKENGILVSLTVFRLGCVEVPAMQTGTFAEKDSSCKLCS